VWSRSTEWHHLARSRARSAAHCTCSSGPAGKRASTARPGKSGAFVVRSSTLYTLTWQTEWAGAANGAVSRARAVVLQLLCQLMDSNVGTLDCM
jgi:hypothetical protein